MQTLTSREEEHVIVQLMSVTLRRLLTESKLIQEFKRDAVVTIRHSGDVQNI